MKKNLPLFKALTFVLLLCISFTTASFANSGEPPGFTIIVLSPPSDLRISILFPDGITTEPITLDSYRKHWETYYRFYYHMNPQMEKNISSAVLIVSHSGETFQLSLPDALTNRYNNLFTLDLKAQRLTEGASPLRTVALVSLRVLLTLIIEGAMFYLFGFRHKRSWSMFLGVNLVTQGALNLMITGPNIGVYWIIGFVAAEIVIVITEIIAFCLSITEHRKRRIIAFTLIANALSLIIGGYVIASLPV